MSYLELAWLLTFGTCMAMMAQGAYERHRELRRMRHPGSPTTPPPPPDGPGYPFSTPRGSDGQNRASRLQPARAKLAVSGQNDGVGDGNAWHVKAGEPNVKPGSSWLSQGKPKPNDPIVRYEYKNGKPVVIEQWKDSIGNSWQKWYYDKPPAKRNRLSQR